MSDVPMIQGVDCTTREEFIRPATADEIANMEAMRANAEAQRLAAEAKAQRIADLKASAKTKLMNAQPLTEEEASVMVGI